jgi:hypothetical protein
VQLLDSDSRLYTSPQPLRDTSGRITHQRRAAVLSSDRIWGDAAIGPHDANGLEPRIHGHNQDSTETAETFIDEDHAWTIDLNPLMWGHWGFGKTPMQTFLDTTPMAKEKMIAA